MAPSTTQAEQRVSVFDLTGDELAEYHAWHLATFGVPPLAGGAPDDDEDQDNDDADDDDDSADDADDSDDDAEQDDEDDDAEGDDDSWKSKSRKNERGKKAAEKKLKAAEAELAALKKGKQSDTDKAIEKARDEAKAEAQQEVRAARLEVSVTRHASAFADVDDALTQIEAAIKRGDIDADDIFDDNGKVDDAEVEKALKDILKRKPHLAGKGGRFKGKSDARKGSGGAKSEDDKSVDDHLAAIRRHKK